MTTDTTTDTHPEIVATTTMTTTDENGHAEDMTTGTTADTTRGMTTDTKTAD